MDRVSVPDEETAKDFRGFYASLGMVRGRSSGGQRQGQMLSGLVITLFGGMAMLFSQRFFLCIS